jgi:hypothetical protein
MKADVMPAKHTKEHTLKQLRYREIKKESAEQLSKYKKYKAIYDSQPNKDGPIARLSLTRMSQAQNRLKELRSK